MPLFQHYTRQVTDCQLADLNNIGKYSRYVPNACSTYLSHESNTVTWSDLFIWNCQSSRSRSFSPDPLKCRVSTVGLISVKTDRNGIILAWWQHVGLSHRSVYYPRLFTWNWLLCLLMVSLVLAVHAQQLHSSESLSQLLIGPIWTSLAWWVTKMKFPTWEKACLEDQHVRWWSLLLDWPTMAEWLDIRSDLTRLSDCEPLLMRDTTVVSKHRETELMAMFRSPSTQTLLWESWQWSLAVFSKQIWLWSFCLNTMLQLWCPATLLWFQLKRLCSNYIVHIIYMLYK